jgi:hypothetical protein
MSLAYEGSDISTLSYRRTVSMASSPTPSTHSSLSLQESETEKRTRFQARFQPIWQRFRAGKLMEIDRQWLEENILSIEDYNYYSDVNNFRRGVELVDGRIVLIEVPTRPHESVAEQVKAIVASTYNLRQGGDIMSLGSAGIQFLLYNRFRQTRRELQLYERKTTRLLIHPSQDAASYQTKRPHAHARNKQALSQFSCRCCLYERDD